MPQAGQNPKFAAGAGAGAAAGAGAGAGAAAGAGAGAAAGAGADTGRGPPQLLQNFEPSLLAAPQLGHTAIIIISLFLFSLF